MKMKLATSLLFSLISSILSSQDVQWKADWIMHPTADPQEHSVIIFRKNFDLKEKPGNFVIHISADNHYRLFVNGNYLFRGPARGDLSHWFFETADIAPYLKAGKNTIAVEVVNWGPKRSFTYFSQMTSFIMQGATERESVVNTFGGSWKCFRNEAIKPKIVEWMTDRNTIDFGLYVGNPTDSIRADKYPWGWEKPDFDDSRWTSAKWADIAGGRGKQFAGGILYGGGKMLIPRRTGILVEKQELFREVRRTSGVPVSQDFIRGTGSLNIPAGKKVSILIDNGAETLGYPELITSGGKDARVQVMYAENMIIKNHAPKGNRNDIEGKRLVGIKDVFIPDGGENRLFKPLYVRAFRYIQLDIETREQPLTINSFYNVSSKAPVELKARFETDDPLYNWIMEAGWRTISICAQDMLLSDAAYEQMQYTGDSRVHNLSLLTLSGDDRLTRNSLIQFNQSRIPEGLTYACYPNPFHLIIPSYSLIWIDQVYDYFYWNDDREFIRQFEPGIIAVIDWFERKRQENGLLEKIDWWAALAWPRHYENGEPPDVYKGNNTLYTLHYAYTLRHAAEILSFSSKPEMAAEYIKRADEICASVNRLCRNGDGFYTESPENKQVSQITNILAILAGALSGNDATALMQKLLEPKDWFGQVDLFLHIYLFEALEKTGLQNYFYRELSEWKLMKDRGMTSFAEVPLEWGEENQRSECHPWSSSPVYHFFRTVCGIKPLAFGHREVVIEPHPGHLSFIIAEYPSHHGIIKLNLKNDSGRMTGIITIPEEINASLNTGDGYIKLHSGENKVYFRIID